MHKEIPSYSDVKDQDYKWMPEDIFWLWQEGHTKTQIKSELDVPIMTVNRYIYRLEKGDIISPRNFYRNNRNERSQEYGSHSSK